MRSLRYRLPAIFLLGVLVAGLVAAVLAVRLFQDYTRDRTLSELRRQARGLAQLARQRTGDDQRQQIELVYRRALGRPPTAAQMDRAERFLAERSAASAADGGGDETVAERQGGSTDPLVLLCLALLNTNEFVYVD